MTGRVEWLVRHAARAGFAIVRTEAGAALVKKREGATCPGWLKERLAESRTAILDWLDGRREEPDDPITPLVRNWLTSGTADPDYRQTFWTRP